jgi:hypothetical protein
MTHLLSDGFTTTLLRFVISSDGSSWPKKLPHSAICLTYRVAMIAGSGEIRNAWANVRQQISTIGTSNM